MLEERVGAFRLENLATNSAAENRDDAPETCFTGRDDVGGNIADEQSVCRGNVERGADLFDLIRLVLPGDVIARAWAENVEVLEEPGWMEICSEHLLGIKTRGSEGHSNSERTDLRKRPR